MDLLNDSRRTQASEKLKRFGLSVVCLDLTRPDLLHVICPECNVGLRAINGVGLARTHLDNHHARIRSTLGFSVRQLEDELTDIFQKYHLSQEEADYDLEGKAWPELLGAPISHLKRIVGETHKIAGPGYACKFTGCRKFFKSRDSTRNHLKKDHETDQFIAEGGRHIVGQALFGENNIFPVNVLLDSQQDDRSSAFITKAFKLFENITDVGTPEASKDAGRQSETSTWEMKHQWSKKISDINLRSLARRLVAIPEEFKLLKEWVREYIFQIDQTAWVNVPDYIRRELMSHPR